jgi:branched-chain amino acid transport system permease protein
MTLTSFTVHLLNALSFSMLLFCIAVGLSVIFGVLKIINFAHGALYMMGAYLAFQITGVWGLPFWPSLLIVPTAVALLGALMERLFLRHIYSRDITVQLLMTFAFVLILDDVVRLIWGPGIHTAPRPELLSGTVEVVGRSYPVYALFVIAVGPLLALGLWWLIERTSFGRRIRAAASDREMASALGVNVPLVFTGVFALGSFLAGVGGTLAAPLRSVAPSMGENIIILAFIVAVIGGLGSFPGALLGSLIVGLLLEFGPLFIPRSEMALAYVAMALVLLVRPTGLFGKEMLHTRG